MVVAQDIAVVGQGSRVTRSKATMIERTRFGRVIALCAFSAAGCGGATESVVAPSRLHTLGASSAYAVAYDSRGRGAYVAVSGANSDSVGMKVCSEPSPDASANLSSKIASEFAANANATIKAIQIAAGGSGKGNEEASSQIVDVAQRTELVLVLRESLYRLCELNINGVLSDPQAVEAFGEVLRTTRQLAQRDVVGKLVAALEKVLSSELSADERTVLASTLINAILTMSAVEIAGKANDASITDAAAAFAIGSALGDAQRFDNLLRDIKGLKSQPSPTPAPANPPNHSKE